MKLFNTLSRQVEELKPLKTGHATIYSCGPTVYDHVHIGNWRAFVFADILRRVLRLNGLGLKALMNVTDVDDKTIHRAVEEKTELKTVTQRYEKLFLQESEELGIDMSLTKVVRATDQLDSMRQLIRQIQTAGYAYVADDGVYFSVSKFAEKFPYGVLSNVSFDPTQAHHRINNDEYDKADARDFALWKKSDPGEPAWDLELDGQTIAGRPGWHIECSAMAAAYLGQPFDIHTGGIDLVFPHHENEIAQSKAATGQDLAKFFVHNEHLLVDGKKMSKSLNNFYTLEDIKKKGFNPLALRLLFLQSHYRTQENFTWEALAAAQNTLVNLYAWADLRHQPAESVDSGEFSSRHEALKKQLAKALENDLSTPEALAELANFINYCESVMPLGKAAAEELSTLIHKLDDIFGLGLGNDRQPNQAAKELISRREEARRDKDFAKADQLRQELANSGFEIDDTPSGPRWRRTKL